MEKNILIIEDDEFLRSLVAKKLKDAGFNVFESINGSDGIKKIIKEKPDIVLLDLLLPDIDGFEVLEKIRSEKDLSDVPVIVLSNLSDKEEINRCLEKGIVDYLIKAQFTPEEIVVKVKEVLSAKR